MEEDGRVRIQAAASGQVAKPAADRTKWRPFVSAPCFSGHDED